MQTDPKLASLSPALARLLAVAAGAAVANSYYNQAFLGMLAAQFGIGAGAVTWVPMLTQTGNALGVLFLAPLGDRLERRSLILMTTAGLVLALVAAARAPDFLWLAGASLAVGLLATVAQQIVPLGVHLAAPEERGRVLGVLTGGILIGILSARVAGGVISDRFGWAAVFWAAAGGMAVVGLALARWLPRVPPTTDLGYLRLIGSLWTLARTHRTLRVAVGVQALLFAALIGFWATLGLRLAEPDHGLGGSAVGLLALVGVAGALTAPLAGRFADRYGAAGVVSLGAGLVVIAFGLFAASGSRLVGLIAGILVLDLGVQAAQVANQARVYALDPMARSRLNTVFMAVMLAGGAAGAGGAGAAYASWGWAGVCSFGAAAAGLALILSGRVR